MSRIAFVFPGQGAQKCGMGKDFYENTEIGRSVFDRASELLGFSMPELCFEENDRLDITEYTQAAMVTASIAMMEVLKARGVKPDVAAGLSLGEYCALVAAGVMSADDAISTVRQRGILMQEAVPVGEGAMAAILALDASAIEEVTGPMEDVWIANYNCPGQLVIGGEQAAVDQAAALAKELGAKRCLPLKVSGPFHTSLLAPAGDALREKFKETTFGAMRIPVLFNCLGREMGPEDTIPALLEKQVQTSVYMEDTIRRLAELGVDTIVEIGPGKALSGFVKKTAPAIKTYAVETCADLDALSAALKG